MSAKEERKSVMDLGTVRYDLSADADLSRREARRLSKAATKAARDSEAMRHRMKLERWDKERKERRIKAARNDEAQAIYDEENPSRAGDFPIDEHPFSGRIGEY